MEDRLMRSSDISEDREYLERRRQGLPASLGAKDTILPKKIGAKTKRIAAKRKRTEKEETRVKVLYLMHLLHSARVSDRLRRQWLNSHDSLGRPSSSLLLCLRLRTSVINSRLGSESRSFFGVHRVWRPFGR